MDCAHPRGWSSAWTILALAQVIGMPNYCTYYTFCSHVKARVDVDIKTFDIRFGSDDEGGLTKALDSVFPNSSTLLCTKHIQDNVIDHSKSKLPMTNDECNDVIEDIFGVDGLVDGLLQQIFKK